MANKGSTMTTGGQQTNGTGELLDLILHRTELHVLPITAFKKSAEKQLAASSPDSSTSADALQQQNAQERGLHASVTREYRPLGTPDLYKVYRSALPIGLVSG